MPAACDIQAVTLDVGGTLIECWPSVGHIYAEVAARYTTKKLSPGVLNRRFAAAWRAQETFQHSRAEWAALVDETFAGLLEVPPSRTFFPELYERFSHPDAWHIFEDVLPALQTLAARGLKLGVISNWDERLTPLLGKLGLASQFAAVIVSREVGAAKPSPAIFHEAARRLGLPPTAILHVGDSPALDVAGARAAGMRALLLKRSRRKAPAGMQRACIGSLRELGDPNLPGTA